MGEVSAVAAVTPDAIVNAVADAVRTSGAALSAWPGQFPGAWATAAEIAERLGLPTAQLTYTLTEMVAAGALCKAQPWPGGLKGYQVAPTAPEPGTAMPHVAASSRDGILDALRVWAQLHDGKAPSRADWSRSRDPERRWPRSDRVNEIFEKEARRQGVRALQPTRCTGCTCGASRHWRRENDGEVLCEGCFDCDGECPHGHQGERIGPSGWQYALQLAGLQVRTGGDYQATAAQQLGRNRQMVTGGTANVHPQNFQP